MSHQKPDSNPSESHRSQSPHRVTRVRHRARRVSKREVPGPGTFCTGRCRAIHEDHWYARRWHVVPTRRHCYSGEGHEKGLHRSLERVARRPCTSQVRVVKVLALRFRARASARTEVFQRDLQDRYGQQPQGTLLDGQHADQRAELTLLPAHC